MRDHTRRLARLAVCLVFCLLVGRPAAAGWKDTLERPLSPGTVALLVAHANEPAVQEYWGRALGDLRPEVRAAAARVANVTGAISLAPKLLTALEKETDVSVALEELRAIAALSGPDADGRLIGWAGRDARFPWLVANVLARARGVGARVHLGALREAGLTDTEVVEFFRLMSRTDPASIDALGSVVVRDGEASAWAAILRTARDAKREPGAPILAASLTSPSPRMREVTYWHLLLSSGGLEETTLAETPEASPEETSREVTPGSRFAYELLRRRKGAPPRHLDEWTDLLRYAATPEGLPSEVTQRELLDLLSAVERATLSEALAGERNGLEEEDPRPVDKPAGGKAADLPWDTTRLPEHYPPGFVDDLVAVTECQLRNGAYGAGLVGYRRDGRPKTVKLLTSDSPCQELVSALIVTALSPSRVPPEHTALLLVPLAPDPLSCIGDSAPKRPRQRGAHGPVTPGGKIEAPRKTVDVPPEYPEPARRAGVQGILILEAHISPVGCVEQLKILRGIPLLDLSAFLAVSQWRYTPTLLDGEAVPVIMTVTVNFRLN